MRVVRLLTLMLLLAVLMAASLPQTAEAWLGKRKQKKAEKAAVEQVQTYQPPAPDALEVYCEPHRQKAAKLSKTPRGLKIFVHPQRAWHIHQHEKCKAEYMSQERLYLKNVDIQRSPSLPKLKTDLPLEQSKVEKPVTSVVESHESEARDATGE